MKKTLFLLAAAAIALVGCNEKVEQKSNVTAITMETEIAFVLDDSTDFALTVLPTPDTETLDYAKLSFESADEAVAVVTPEGIVTATGIGETTITAKYEELTAVCNVRVVEDEVEILTFPMGAVLQNPLGLVTELEYALTDANGNFVDSVGLALARVPIFSDGFYVDGEGYITGEGYMLNAYTLVFYFVEDGSMGIYGPRKGYEFASADVNPVSLYADCSIDDIKYYILPQIISDAEGFTTFIDLCLLQGQEDADGSLYEAYDASMPYGNVFWIDYVNQSMTYPLGLLDYEGYFFEPRDETYGPRHYNFNINWFGGFYGLAVNEEGTDLVRPFELAEPFTVNYTLAADAAAAPALKKAPKASAMMMQKPERIKANAVTIK